MSKKTTKHKHIKVREETHTIFKAEAKRRDKPMMDYMESLSKRVKAKSRREAA